MKKSQITRIEEHLTDLLRRSDRLEDKAWEYRLGDNSVKAHKCERLSWGLASEIDGICYVLETLGYIAVSDTDNKFTITKRSSD